MLTSQRLGMGFQGCRKKNTGRHEGMHQGHLQHLPFELGGENLDEIL